MATILLLAILVILILAVAEWVYREVLDFDYMGHLFYKFVLIHMVRHLALSIITVHSSRRLHSKKICFEVLVGVYAGAKMTSAQYRVLITRIDNAIDIDLSLSEAETIF